MHENKEGLKMLLIISCLVDFLSNVFYICSSEHYPHHCCIYNISEILVSTGNLNLELQMLKGEQREKEPQITKSLFSKGRG